MLPGMNAMADASLRPSRDWLGSWRSSTLAWWTPHAVLLGGLLAPLPVRVALWTLALLWMGLACILNSRRCGRTHCRYTGPHYLALIVPAVALGLALPSAGIVWWIILGLIVVGGSKLIWWVSERAWGKFS